MSNKRAEKVLLVAGDTAQSNAFRMLEGKLQAQGMNVTSLIGGGKPVGIAAEDLEALVGSHDVVLTGMSSFPENSVEEIKAAEIAELHGLPYGFYADVYGAYERPHFHHLREGAKFLFVLNAEEKDKASVLFPKTDVVPSGNPTWENYFFPQYTREEVRTQFGVEEDEIMVLIPGTTVLERNVFLLSALTATLKFYPSLSDQKWKLFYAVHPGDLMYRTNDKVYDSFREWSKYPFTVVPKSTAPSSSMIPGADYILDCGTSIGIEAAHQRKKVICYFSEFTLNAEGAYRHWTPCEKGVMHLVEHSTDKLAEAFSMDFGKIHERQTIVYSAPLQKGYMINTMAETVRRHASLATMS